MKRTVALFLTVFMLLSPLPMVAVSASNSAAHTTYLDTQYRQSCAVTVTPDVIGPPWPVTPTDPATPSDVVFGDVSGDNKVDASDALMVLKTAVGKLTLPDAQILAGDVNGDGKLDAGDGLDILKKAVGTLSSFLVQRKNCVECGEEFIFEYLGDGEHCLTCYKNMWCPACGYGWFVTGVGADGTTCSQCLYVFHP